MATPCLSLLIGVHDLASKTKVAVLYSAFAAGIRLHVLDVPTEIVQTKQDNSAALLNINGTPLQEASFAADGNNDTNQLTALMMMMTMVPFHAPNIHASREHIANRPC